MINFWIFRSLKGKLLITASAKKPIKDANTPLGYKNVGYPGTAQIGNELEMVSLFGVFADRVSKALEEIKDQLPKHYKDEPVEVEFKVKALWYDNI
jgi:hypothetical protein